MNRASILSLLLVISLGCQPPASNSNPNDFDFLEASITDLQAQFDEGSLTVEALTQAYLDRIAAVDHSGPNLQSVLQVNPDALDIARDAGQGLPELEP